MGLQEIFDKIQIFYDKFDHGPGQYSAERVAQRAEYHALIRKTFYLSVEEYNNFNSAYAGKKPQQFVRYAPNPQLDGYYKVGIMGLISNPGTGWKGYLPTGNYFLYQLKCVLNFSKGALSGLSFEFSIVGIIIAVLFSIALVCLGISVRLPIAIILTLFQFVFVLFATKNENTSTDNNSN